MIERRFVEINDLEVSYLIKPSDKPKVTIVFIHGFPFSSEIWRKQLEPLDENVQGIAYDIRGFGESSTDHPFFSIDLFARDLCLFIEGLSLENVVLCGVSMGGYIALRVIEIAPELISGLILCDTNASSDSNEGKLKRFASIDEIMRNGTDKFAENFVANLFSDHTLRSGSKVPEFIHDLIMSTLPQVICSTQLALASRTDSTGALEAIKVPVLVIRGTDDRLMTQEQAGVLKESIRNSELETIPHAGHLPNCEAPAVFNSKLKDYLSKHFLS
ncbi:alpha/beta fold hydrolase [Arcticibacter tournemirensis]